MNQDDVDQFFLRMQPVFDSLKQQFHTFAVVGLDKDGQIKCVDAGSAASVLGILEIAKARVIQRLPSVQRLEPSKGVQ